MRIRQAAKSSQITCCGSTLSTQLAASSIPISMFWSLPFFVVSCFTGFIERKDPKSATYEIGTQYYKKPRLYLLKDSSRYKPCVNPCPNSCLTKVATIFDLRGSFIWTQRSISLLRIEYFVSLSNQWAREGNWIGIKRCWNRVIDKPKAGIRNGPLVCVRVQRTKIQLIVSLVNK